MVGATRVHADNPFERLAPGGHWHYTMHGPDGTDYPNKTVYHEVELHRKLVYDHGANDTQPPLFRVTALFSEWEGKTKLQLTMALASAEAATEIRKFIRQAGGNATWDRLAEFLSETVQRESCFVFNRSFDCSSDRLHQAWTVPSLLTQWWPRAGISKPVTGQAVDNIAAKFSRVRKGIG